MFLEQTHTVKEQKGRVWREEVKEMASEQTMPAANDTSTSRRGNSSRNEGIPVSVQLP